jgi:hypothetical protein
MFSGAQADIVMRARTAAKHDTSSSIIDRSPLPARAGVQSGSAGMALRELRPCTVARAVVPRIRRGMRIDTEDQGCEMYEQDNEGLC